MTMEAGGFQVVAAYYRHQELQREWYRIVQRGGLAEPALTIIEDELRRLRQRFRDEGVKVLPPLAEKLLFLLTADELYELHEKLVGKLHGSSAGMDRSVARRGRRPVSEIAEAATDLGPLLITVAALIGQPDTDGSTGAGGKPGSRPPWTPAAAAAFYDAHAAIRETETVFRFIVTGHSGPPRSWSDGNTTRALAAIVSLSHAVPHDHVKRAARDLAARRDRHHAAPRSGRGGTGAADPGSVPVLRVRDVVGVSAEGLVACLRGGVCRDGDGHPPRGRAVPGRLGPCIEWNDGLVT